MAKPARHPWFLRDWRKHRGLTQDELGRITGLSKPYISQLERGVRQYNRDLLELFADTLKCAPADLLARDPTDPEGLWTLLVGLSPAQRAQAVKVIKAISGVD